MRMLRRFLIVPSLLLLIGKAASASIGFDTPVQWAIVVEAESGAVLYGKAADERFAPASLAKLMTMAVLFRELASFGIAPTEEYLVSAPGGVAGQPRAVPRCLPNSIRASRSTI